MQLLLILLLVSSGACQQCFNYSGNQQGCLTSLSACRWVQETNQCMPAILQNMGCFNQLSQASCLNQISNPDGSHAYCLFSGYCRNLSAPVTNCASTLSQAACLSVVGQLCIWSNGCTQVTATQVINYTSASWAYASVGVCQLMTTQPVVHILGAYSVLYSFWLVAKQTSSTLASSYLTQLQIPGCLVATSEMLAQMNCQTIGLNQLSCIQISQAGLYCGFINGSCQNVSSFSTLTCTQALNKNACLAITNYASPCYWDSSCKLFAVDATTTCTDQKYPISVSVCQNIQTQECFYNQTTFQCYQSCRSTYYMSGSLQCATNTACRYNSIISQCQINLLLALMSIFHVSNITEKPHSYVKDNSHKEINYQTLKNEVRSTLIDKYSSFEKLSHHSPPRQSNKRESPRANKTRTIDLLFGKINQQENINQTSPAKINGLKKKMSQMGIQESSSSKFLLSGPVNDFRQQYFESSASKHSFLSPQQRVPTQESSKVRSGSLTTKFNTDKSNPKLLSNTISIQRLVEIQNLLEMTPIHELQLLPRNYIDELHRVASSITRNLRHHNDMRIKL